MKSKNGINRYLEKKFVAFSCLIVLIFLMAYGFISVMGNKYVLREAQYYFAQSLIRDDYQSIDSSHVDSMGGWVTILNSDFEVEYSSNSYEKLSYNEADIIDLQNGEYLHEGEMLYGSVKKFVGQDGDIKYGLVVIPSQFINVKTTLTNINTGVVQLLFIFVGGLMIVIAGFSIAVFGLSHYMKKQLTNPLELLVKGFSRVSEGEFDEQLTFEGVDEFVVIRDSFNKMSKRLFDLEVEKKELDAQRQKLFAAIGHDLKTPITVISGYSGALVEKRVPEDQIDNANKIINNSAKNMAELIDFLLDYTRLNCSDYELHLEKYDLCEFMRQTIIQMIPQFEERNVEIKVNIPSKEIIKELDTKIFKRAITNLLANILQHNDAGVAAYIEIDSQGSIAIADSGNAIGDELARKMYEPFVSGDESRKSGSNNSGLGLSITKSIVEKHGGRIHIENDYKGYTKAFIIEF